MSNEQVPVCATCQQPSDDDDLLVGFLDFHEGAYYHTTCMTNVLHEALVGALRERDEARALLRQAEDERDAAQELAAFLSRQEAQR